MSWSSVSVNNVLDYRFWRGRLGLVALSVVQLCKHGLGWLDVAAACLGSEEQCSNNGGKTFSKVKWGTVKLHMSKGRLQS